MTAHDYSADYLDNMIPWELDVTLSLLQARLQRLKEAREKAK